MFDEFFYYIDDFIDLLRIPISVITESSVFPLLIGVSLLVEVAAFLLWRVIKN